MVIEAHEKVHITIRREFSDDLRRHFIGEVERISDAMIRVKGYMFIYDMPSSMFVKSPNIREQLFSMTDRGNMITLLPSDALLTDIMYQKDEDHRLVLSDGINFKIDVNEFGTRY
jgi:hypothetical protein